MIQEFLMPLNRHFDSGFGATADSFHDAAKALDIEEHKFGFGLNRSRLPVFYLYRHATELYLKSILTILHRRFCSSFPNVRQDDFPAIQISGKAKRIFDVHSLSHLYRELRTILDKNAAQIKSTAKTDWTSVPVEIDGMISLINDADESSAMFRYPVTLDPANDAKKSAFKKVDPEQAISAAKNRDISGKPGVKILALTNDDDEIVEMFMHDSDAMLDVFDALKHVTERLSGAHVGMRYEFLNTQ